MVAFVTDSCWFSPLSTLERLIVDVAHSPLTTLKWSDLQVTTIDGPTELIVLPSHCCWFNVAMDGSWRASLVTWSIDSSFLFRHCWGSAAWSFSLSSVHKHLAGLGGGQSTTLSGSFSPWWIRFPTIVSTIVGVILISFQPIGISVAQNYQHPKLGGETH